MNRTLKTLLLTGALTGGSTGGATGGDGNPFVYGVRWDTVNDVMTGGRFYGDSFVAGTFGTPIQDTMRRCVVDLVGRRARYYLGATDSALKAGTPTPAAVTVSVAGGWTLGSYDAGTYGFAVGKAAVFAAARKGMMLKNTTAGKGWYCRIISAAADQIIVASADDQVSGSAHVPVAPLADGDTFWIGDAILDGSDGPVCVEVPKFCYRMWLDGNNSYMAASQRQFSGSAVHPLFTRGAATVNMAYLDAFKGSRVSSSGVVNPNLLSAGGDTLGTDILRSVAGARAWNYQTIGSNRAAYARGGQFASHYWARHALMLLWLGKYKTFNAQTNYDGHTNDTWSELKIRKNGRTLGLGNATGRIAQHTTLDAGLASGYIATSILGIENPFGSIWEFLDGLRFWEDATSVARAATCTDPTKFSDAASTYPAQPDGYSNIATPLAATDDWQKSLIAGHFLPATVGGGAGSSSYITDYFYRDSATNAWRIAIVGAGLDIGSSAGLLDLNASWSSGGRGRNVGGRGAF